MVKDDHRESIAEANREVRQEKSNDNGKVAADRENRKKQSRDSSDPIVEENRELREK